MSYIIGWKDGHIDATTAEEARVALDSVAAMRRAPMLMHVSHHTGTGGLIELVWGDPERAMLSYADDDWDGQAVEPSMPLADRDLDYDYGSIEPDRTRLSAKMARAAVAEFVVTGKRPTCVTWEQ